MQAKDHSGATPLTWAERNGHQAIVRLLLSRNGVREARQPARLPGVSAPLRQALSNVDGHANNHAGRSPRAAAAAAVPVQNHFSIARTPLAQPHTAANREHIYGRTPMLPTMGIGRSGPAAGQRHHGDLGRITYSGNPRMLYAAQPQQSGFAASAGPDEETTDSVDVASPSSYYEADEMADNVDAESIQQETDQEHENDGTGSPEDEYDNWEDSSQHENDQEYPLHEEQEVYRG